ncbi:Mth938-like domain-containing protein [Magnetospirillum molischianum]|nr:Mth938-like domain-containing protein [Magnetospirillum molischianum]
MDLNPRLAPGRQLIQAYGDGGFLIAGQRWCGSVLVFPEATQAWACADIAALGLEALAPVIAAAPIPELLLVGCGPALRPLPPTVRAGLAAAGVRVETMDTGAACRTFNVLLTEDRRIAAALFAV